MDEADAVAEMKQVDKVAVANNFLEQEFEDDNSRESDVLDDEVNAEFRDEIESTDGSETTLDVENIGASPIEKPEVSEEDKFKSKVYKTFCDQLVQEFCEGLCFEVHSSVKQGLFDFDAPVDENFMSSDEEVTHKEAPLLQAQDIFGNQKGKIKYPFVNCPICAKKLEATRFTTHLEKCMGMGGRRSSRMTKINFGEVDSDYDDYDNDSDPSYNSKKRSKKRQNKTHKGKTARYAKGYEYITIPPDPVDYSNLTHDEKKLFFNQSCGVISKHTKRVCQKSIKCKQHNDQQRSDIRMHELGSIVHMQAPEETVINVETIEDDPPVQPMLYSITNGHIWNPNFSVSSSTHTETRPDVLQQTAYNGLLFQ